MTWTLVSDRIQARDAGDFWMGAFLGKAEFVDDPGTRFPPYIFTISSNYQVIFLYNDIGLQQCIGSVTSGQRRYFIKPADLERDCA